MARQPSAHFLKLLEELKECHVQEICNSRADLFKSELAQSELQKPVVHMTRGDEDAMYSTWREDDALQKHAPMASPSADADDALHGTSAPCECAQPAKPDDEGSQGTDPTNEKLEHTATSRVSIASADDQIELKLKPLWAGNQRMRSQIIETQASEMTEIELTLDSFESVKGGSDGIWKYVIAFPGSNIRLGWDMVGALLVFYDMIYIPFGTFEPPETTPTIFMDWFTLVFWTLNVPATVTVGYIDSGSATTIMDPKLIMQNYLKSWFIIDLLTLGPDWITTIMFSGGVGDSMKLLRTLRLTRTMRLLRLVKLRRVILSITDCLDSEYTAICFSIVKMLILLLMVNHLIACLWFAIGSLGHQDQFVSWTEDFGIADAAISEQYLVSLHWSLTQFTPASMQVQPVTELERLFAVLVLIFALVGFAYVIGSITGSLAQLRSMTEKKARDFWLLRRFLRLNKVPKVLCLRIQRYLEHMHTQSESSMSPSQVHVLSMLSKQLNDELQCTISLPQLSVHPLFAYLKKSSFITVSRLAKEAVAGASFARGDTLFLPGQHATSMYMLTSGMLEYHRTSGATMLPPETVTANEDWISEPAIWMESWYHLGQAVSMSECSVLVISSNMLSDVILRVKPVAGTVAIYASRFMQWMRELQDKDCLSDVIQGDQMAELIASFIPGN